MLAALFCDVAHCGAEIPTNMAGNVSCAGYLKARLEKKTLPFELWLSGYLTGLATYDKKINNVAKLEIANSETGTVLLESYCKRHPQESYQIAAREMARTVFYQPGR
ncbi:MAG: hypothetical protein A2075_11700 [Geobacteraceae bacterium GWC2_58_44]|nr:MAG: hypothetical protein A2075_11700 [Geobacteraceae bacterium GWC2_58_44]HBG08292.1 hypothetical protein [Geobacter sp.]